MMKNSCYKKLYGKALLEISRLERQGKDLKTKLRELESENKYLKNKLEEWKNKNANTLSEAEVSGNSSQYFLEAEVIDKGYINRNSTTKEKINLYLSIFKVREDICAVRWESSKSGKTGYSPYCKNEWRQGVCGKIKGVKCKDCKYQDFFVLDENTMRLHFLGKKVLGGYPLNKSNLCKFIVIDLDKDNWADEARIIIGTAKKYKVSGYLERSRSGNGCHIWFFFDTWIKAALARKLVFILLDKAMEEAIT